MKKNYKIFTLMTVWLLSLISFSSCKDDDWEPLKWTVVNPSPENIVVQTRSDYDPFGVQQTVIANEEGGEIIFYCKNYDNLYLIGEGYTINDNTFNNDIISMEVNGNKIIINFPKLEEISEERCVILEVKTRDNKHPLTYFMVIRASDLNWMDKVNNIMD